MREGHVGQRIPHEREPLHEQRREDAAEARAVGHLRREGEEERQRQREHINSRRDASLRRAHRLQLRRRPRHEHGAQDRDHVIERVRDGEGRRVAAPEEPAQHERGEER